MPRTTAPPRDGLGLQTEDERLYWLLLSMSGFSPAQIATARGTSTEELLADAEPLVRLGITTVSDQAISTRSPTQTLALVVRAQAHRAARLGSRLEALADVIPSFGADAFALPEGSRHLDGELLEDDGGLAERVHAWITQSAGELFWLRPDQWRLPSNAMMTDAMQAAVAGGRRSRAIYPVEALREAPEVLRSRAQAGEEVRVLAEVPFRMVGVGERVILQQFRAAGAQHRVVVRQGTLVAVCRSLFELMWDQARAVPDLDLGEARPDLRRLLLDQLAQGAKDEQIARALGVSLRTVRRRVAHLLIELGVDSRFQAGVEAARRGWL